jgi:hypothetical protein
VGALDAIRAIPRGLSRLLSRWRFSPRSISNEEHISKVLLKEFLATGSSTPLSNLGPSQDDLVVRIPIFRMSHVPGIMEFRQCDPSSNLVLAVLLSRQTTHRQSLDASLYLAERALAFYGKDYTKDQYTQAKNQNFGITYGQSPEAFHQMYGIPIEEATAYNEAWWRDFPQIKKWTIDLGMEATTNGVVVNPIGRKRRFALITRQNKGEVEREAVNFKPQSTASEFTLASVVELNARGVPVVSTVHDSIVADVPENMAYEVGREMKEVMEAMPKKMLGWELPFLVDISIGPNWGSVEEVEI